jgi:DNA (cytosine-5)-methyltransferase 1
VFQSISREAASTLRIGSLCTGYGGLDLAVEAYFNAKTIWAAEFDAYASQVVEQRFNVPNYGNIKEIDWALMPEIDILTAGYPCQPFSTAGERKGLNDERHIFPYIAKAISILRPKYVVLENVRGHISLGLKEVLTELTLIGYDARWQIVRASDVGAPHQRARLFIVAYPNSHAREESRRTNRSVHGKAGKIIDRADRPIDWDCNTYEKIASNTQSGGSRNESIRVTQTNAGFSSYHNYSITDRDVPHPLDQDGKLNPKYVEYMMGLPDGWVTDCDLTRHQQLKMLGNGVVPQQAYYALQLLCDAINISHNETLYQPMLGDA